MRNEIVDTVMPGELDDEALIKLIVGEVFAEKPRRSKNFGEENSDFGFKSSSFESLR